MRGRHLSSGRVIQGAHGKASEPRGQQHLQPWERGEDWRPSRRQLECLVLSGEGLNHKQIAEVLGLDRETVRSHTKRLRDGLLARNMAHAYAIAYRRGWLEHERIFAPVAGIPALEPRV